MTTNQPTAEQPQAHTPTPWSVGHTTPKPSPSGSREPSYEATVHCGSEKTRGNCIAIVYMGGDGALRWSKEAVEANANHIVHCVNTHAALVARVAELEGALLKLRDWRDPASVQGIGEYEQGLLCGIEDRGYQGNGYDGMRYGYEAALDRVAEEIDGTIEEALAALNPQPTEAR